MELAHLTIVKGQPALKQVDQHHCVVVSIASFPVSVGVPPLSKEAHGAGAFPAGAQMEIAARAVNGVYYSLPGLFS